MDTTNTQAPANTDHNRPGSSKFGLGVFLTAVAVLFALAATVLIWLGVFPGLAAIGVALPLGISGVRLMRQGQPATTIRE